MSPSPAIKPARRTIRRHKQPRNRHGLAAIPPQAELTRLFALAKKRASARGDKLGPCAVWFDRPSRKYNRQLFAMLARMEELRGELLDFVRGVEVPAVFQKMLDDYGVDVRACFAVAAHILADQIATVSTCRLHETGEDGEDD